MVPDNFIHAGALQGTATTFDRRIHRKRLLQQRCDVSGVVRDRKIGQIDIGLSGRNVVVAVVSVDREIRSSHGLPQEADANSGCRTEQTLPQRGLLRCRKLIGDYPCRGIGQRGAKAVHLLELSCRVHRDDAPGRAPASFKIDAGLRLQQLRAVPRGLNDLDRRSDRGQRGSVASSRAGKASYPASEKN